MNIEWKITNEGLIKLNKWKEQQPNSSNGRYPIQIISIIMNEYDGTVTYKYTPLVHVKDKIELTANKDCNNCHGTGCIRYWYYQDESRTANCPECFPNDLKAQQALKEWLKFTRD